MAKPVKKGIENIERRVKEIIIERLGVNEDKVTLEASLLEDLRADSLDTVELVIALEEEYGVDISDAGAESIKTVQDVVNYIDDHEGDGRKKP